LETKEVEYRGGVVTFSIPKHWKEEYDPEGGGTFYEDGPDTGTLRLNVLTAKSPGPITEHSPKQALLSTRLARSASDIEQLSQGNALAKSLRQALDRNQEILIYGWHIANPVPPQHVRIANFTYTILSRFEKEPRIQSELGMLDKLIRAAKFHSLLGN
jgi:hypothetical protein